MMHKKIMFIDNLLMHVKNDSFSQKIYDPVQPKILPDFT